MSYRNKMAAKMAAITLYLPIILVEINIEPLFYAKQWFALSENLAKQRSNSYNTCRQDGGHGICHSPYLLLKF